MTGLSEYTVLRHVGLSPCYVIVAGSQQGRLNMIYDMFWSIFSCLQLHVLMFLWFASVSFNWDLSSQFSLLDVCFYVQRIKLPVGGSLKNGECVQLSKLNCECKWVHFNVFEINFEFTSVRCEYGGECAYVPTPNVPTAQCSHISISYLELSGFVELHLT